MDLLNLYSRYSSLVIGRPGNPVITGVPPTPVAPGTRVTIVCRSLGTSSAVWLIWYKNGLELDNSYGVVGRHVENSYDYIASLGDTMPLECRLEYQPLSIRESAFAAVPVLGQLLPHTCL